jgi:transposase
LFPSVSATKDRPEPDCARIHRERHRPNVTLELLHREYLERHSDGLRYTTSAIAIARGSAVAGW